MSSEKMRRHNPREGNNEEEERIFIDWNNELKTVEEYQKLLPPTSPEEDEALENSILRDGQREPLIVNQKKIVLDGHRRLRVCRKHGIKPKYIMRKFESELEEKKFIIEINLIRRQLTTFQRIELALPLIAIERELAEKRKKAGKPLKDLPQNFGEGGEALKIIAGKIGVSHETVRQAIYVIEHASEEELYKLRRGEKSVYRVYTELKNAHYKGNNNSGIPRFLARLIARANKRTESIKLKINRYANSEFADIMVERSLIEKYENGCLRAKELGQPIDLELIIREALEDYWRRFERALRALEQSNG